MWVKLQGVLFLYLEYQAQYSFYDGSCFKGDEGHIFGLFENFNAAVWHWCLLLCIYIYKKKILLLLSIPFLYFF